MSRSFHYAAVGLAAASGRVWSGLGRLALAVATHALVSPTVAWADDSTAAMAALLRERAAAIDPMKVPAPVNDRRAAIFEERLTWPRPMVERLSLRADYASELLKAGRIQESLDALAALQQDLETNAPAAWREHRNGVFLARAIAYLRMAEEENCHQGEQP